MVTVKITCADGNDIIAQFPKWFEEHIIGYYSNFNEVADKCNMPQVKRIEWLDPSDDYSSKVYLFIDYDGSGILQ